MSDELAGWPSQERGTNPITGLPGAHQFLGHAANHHGDITEKTPHANRLLPGSAPEPGGPAFGPPDKVNPLGRRFSASLEDDN